MPNLTQAHQESLQMIVIEYLHKGHDIISTRERLQNLRNKQEEKRALSGRALFESTLINSPENKRFITAILGNLGLSDEEQAQYLEVRPATNLYQLLSNLYNDDPVKYNHLRRLLVEVNSIKPPRNWALIFSLGALFSAGIGALFYFRQDYADTIENWARRTMPNVVDWIGRTLSLLRNLPLVMIMIQTLGLAWTWISTFRNSTNNTEYKLSRLFFKTLASGLSIAAYVLLYLSAGVTTPLAAGLFIASPAIGFLKSFYTLLFKTRGDYSDPRTLAQTYESLIANERVGNMLSRNRQTFGVQFLATLLTTAAVATMCMFPASLVIFIACMSFMILVEQARSIWTANIHDACDIELQERIAAINLRDRDERLYPYDSPIHQAITHDIQEIEQNRSEIEQNRLQIKNHQDNLIVRAALIQHNLNVLRKTKANLSLLEEQLAKREASIARRENFLISEESRAQAYKQGVNEGIEIARNLTKHRFFAERAEEETKEETASNEDSLLAADKKTLDVIGEESSDAAAKERHTSSL